MRKSNSYWFVIAISSVLIFVWTLWSTSKNFPRPVDVVKQSQGRLKQKTAKADNAKTKLLNGNDLIGSVVEKKLESTTTTSSLVLTEQSVDDLINRFYMGTNKLNEKSLAEVDLNIKTADSLIERDPNIYAAYKGKLLNMLVRELKYKQSVDPESYDALYDELLDFRGINESIAVSVESKMLSSDFETLEAKELNEIDNDLVHIPFLRLSALGDAQELEATAEEYIAEYPDSHIGYMYLAESLWTQGEKSSAILAAKKIFGQDITDEAVYEVIRRTVSKDPVERITEMSVFE